MSSGTGFDVLFLRSSFLYKRMKERKEVREGKESGKNLEKWDSILYILVFLILNSVAGIYSVPKYLLN